MFGVLILLPPSGVALVQSEGVACRPRPVAIFAKPGVGRSLLLRAGADPFPPDPAPATAAVSSTPTQADLPTVHCHRQRR